MVGRTSRRVTQRRLQSGGRHGYYKSDVFHHGVTLRRVSLAQGRRRQAEETFNLGEGTVTTKKARAEFNRDEGDKGNKRNLTPSFRAEPNK